MTNKEILDLAKHIKEAKPFESIKFSHEQVYYIADFLKDLDGNFPASEWVKFVEHDST